MNYEKASDFEINKAVFFANNREDFEKLVDYSK